MENGSVNRIENRSVSKILLFLPTNSQWMYCVATAYHGNKINRKEFGFNQSRQIQCTTGNRKSDYVAINEKTLYPDKH